MSRRGAGIERAAFARWLARKGPGMATVEERVKAVTARVLGIEPDDIRPEHSFTEDLGAESVQSVELVAMYEAEFGIEMDEEAALAVQTVGGAVEFIRRVCREQGVPVDDE